MPLRLNHWRNQNSSSLLTILRYNAQAKKFSDAQLNGIDCRNLIHWLRRLEWKDTKCNPLLACPPYTKPPAGGASRKTLHHATYLPSTRHTLQERAPLGYIYPSWLNREKSNSRGPLVRSNRQSSISSKRLSWHKRLIRWTGGWTPLTSATRDESPLPKPQFPSHLVAKRSIFRALGPSDQQ